MRVDLYGGPLSGSRVTWPTEEREARFPIAEILTAWGRRYEPGEIVLQLARYRLLPQVGNLWIRPAVARFVGTIEPHGTLAELPRRVPSAGESGPVGGWPAE